MNTVDPQYHTLIRRILDEGTSSDDRTGVGTLSIFGHQMRFDLRQGFPLVTTKATMVKGTIIELLWFLRGDTNTHWLNEYGVRFWNPWADENGDLGPIYGAQWRAWRAPGVGHIDQIRELVCGLKHDPYSRRHILTAWNPADLPLSDRHPTKQAKAGRMALAPCHCLFQFYYRDGRLSGQLYQRSADVFIGVPVNIASYALLLHLFARRLGCEVGELVWTGGDCHLYLNHMTQVNQLLGRDPLPLPTVLLTYEPSRPFEEIEPEEISVVGYAPHPAIPAPVAV